MRPAGRTAFVIAVHAAALAPLALIAWDASTGGLSANPIEDVTQRTGKAAITLLAITLAVSPLRMITGLTALMRVRRALGLYTFLYALLHFLIFVGLDYGFDIGLILEGVAKKRFAIAGFSAFCLLIPLALTSTNGMRRRLGPRWKSLHQLIYPIALIAAMHYLWQEAKGDLRQPFIYLAVIGVLLVLRLPAVKRAVSRRGGTA